MSYLSQDDINFYLKNGYLVIKDFWDVDTVIKLRTSINHIIDNLDLSSSLSVFSTKEQGRRIADEYFLSSGREIRYFWEEKAKVNNEFVKPLRECINKIGHGLHDLHPDFEKVSYDRRLGGICIDLGLKIPLAVQSMFIFKQAHIGGEVGAHQDGAFLYTEPQTCIGFWWALDDCTTQNGCLWAVPGSHEWGVHRRFRRRDSPDDGTEFIPSEIPTWDMSEAVPLEIPKGSLVILHSALVHYSEENTSANARYAYSIHVVDGAPDVKYPADNWLQRPAEHPFRKLPV